MHPLPCRWPADPLAFAIGQGGTAVQAHGPLQNPPGTTAADPMQESPILERGFGMQDPTDHVKPCGPELLHPSTSDPRIRILKGNHHPMDASL